MTEQEKRENVINGLGNCVEYFASKVKGVMFDEWLEESRKAIALLKAQEPVEPVRRRRHGQIGYSCFCGMCGYGIGRNEKYCALCGKAAKWE